MSKADKLADDPIVEAILEIRFDAHELKEVVVGRLSDAPHWRLASKTRLSTADIPEPIRTANAVLKFQPTIELTGLADIGKIRIGGNVISAHFLQPYAGWDEVVFPKLKELIGFVFRTFPSFEIERLGLRYVNVFTARRHFVSTVRDLAVEVRTGGAISSRPINLSISASLDETHSMQARIASRDFLQGDFPDDAGAAVDIDISTPTALRSWKEDDVADWVSRAHELEKSEFRRLLPDSLYERLREKNAPNH